MAETKLTNPIQNLFVDIEKILSETVFKDLNAARDAETIESRDAGDMWIRAKLKEDTYLTYRAYWQTYMFQAVLPNVKLSNISYYKENPMNVPYDFRSILLEKGRNAFFKQYVEQNTYYRMLSGLPPINTPSNEFIYLSKSLADKFQADISVPIHEQPDIVQNRYLNSDEYKIILSSNSDKPYLQYLGAKRIDLFVARRAKDFEIIRYPKNRSDINPNLLKAFGTLYSEYREYVMSTLYNSNLEDVYTNYRSFMGIIILYFTLLQISNKSLEGIHTQNYFDDTVLYMILSMYGLPSNLLLTKEVRRRLVASLRRLTQEKGTDDVYFDIIRILGYQDVNISKLLLMRNQVSDNNKYQFEDNSTLNDFRNIDHIDLHKNHVKTNPHFLQVGLKEEQPYEQLFTTGRIHDYHSIVDSDPTWWDLEETRNILKNSPYSISNSKYIMIEAVIHQMKYLFESIYFTRMLLDNQNFTDRYMISIPELLGVEPVSLYDLAVYILAATCMNAGLQGNIISDPTELHATAGFNFDLDVNLFQTYLNKTKYVEKEKVMAFLNDVEMDEASDVSRLFEDVIYPMRDWLENKIARTDNRQEYIEYESIYRALYSYDVSRNSFLDDFEKPMKVLQTKYSVMEEEMLKYQHFYPRTITGQAITVDTIKGSRYRTPFLDKNNHVAWYVHLIIETPSGEEDRGYIYFHDILNEPDLRNLSNPDGTRPLMDRINEEWVINEKAVEKLIKEINTLPEDGLANAYFQVETSVLNGSNLKFKENELLPFNIRSGLYRDILIDKVIMDILGLCDPPTTYLEYLERKNEPLYDILTKDDRIHKNKEAWMNDVMIVVLAIETELNIHLKYFEQSVVGSNLFFKPLVTLIKHFKSTFVEIARTTLLYNFGDKMDAGGHSNMFKLFDAIKVVIHYVIFSNKGQGQQFGLYDTEHSMKHRIHLNDVPLFVKRGSNGMNVGSRQRLGGISMFDEMLFKKNGKDLDSTGATSHWMPGEAETGRWTNHDTSYDIRTTRGFERITEYPMDMEEWKNYVEK
jgi:hypothetical protein